MDEGLQSNRTEADLMVLYRIRISTKLIWSRATQVSYKRALANNELLSNATEFKHLVSLG